MQAMRVVVDAHEEESQESERDRTSGQDSGYDCQGTQGLRRLTGDEHYLPAFGLDAATAIVPAMNPTVKHAHVMTVTDLVLSAVTAWLDATAKESEHTTAAARQRAVDATRTTPIFQPQTTSNHQWRMASRQRIRTGIRKSPRPRDVDAPPQRSANAGIESPTTNPSIGKPIASSGSSHGSQCRRRMCSWPVARWCSPESRASSTGWGTVPSIAIAAPQAVNSA